MAGMLLWLLLWLTAGAAGAQDDFGLDEEFELLQDEDTVLSASRHEQDIADSPSAVTVITREEISDSHCSDLVCLLRGVPEVDVVEMKPMYATVGARALSDEAGEHALLLVDGREINNEVFGLPFWKVLPVHLEDIERIEVIRGPGSALYGANAHSMVVSVFTRRPSGQSAEAFLGGGEHDRSSLHLRLGQPLGVGTLQLTGGFETDGHVQIPGYRERQISRVRLHFDRESGSSRTSAQIGFAVEPGGPIYNALGPAEMKDATLLDASVSHSFGPLHGQASFSLVDAAVVIFNEVYFTGLLLGRVPGRVPFLSTDLDTSLQATFSPWEDNLLIVGAGYRWLTASSDQTQPGSLYQHRLGVFLHDEQPLPGNLRLTLGVRGDYNSITPFTVSPRLALVWRFAADQRLRLAFGQAFRKPSFFNSSIHLTNVQPEPAFPELTDFFLRSVGNEELGNESIASLEAGYHGRFWGGRLTAEADAFYQQYRHTIVLHVEMLESNLGIPDLRNSVAEYRNNGREVDSLGGSASLTLRLVDQLRAGINYTFRHSFFVSEPGGAADVAEGHKGDRVPWEPAHLANLSLAWLAERGPRLGLFVHLASARKGYTTDEPSTFETRVLVPMPASWFMSAFLSWKLTFGPRTVEIGLRASNPLSLPHRDFPGLQWTERIEMRDQLQAEPKTRNIMLFARGSL